MSRWFARRPSPAMVVAVVALIAALAGSALAAKKLNGKKLVNRSVAGKKLKKNTVTGTEINEDTLIGVSASKLASVRYVSTTVELADADSDGTPAAADCPAGTKVVGGGAIVSDETNGFVNDSGPNASRAGWSATGFANVAGTNMTVTAICTAVATSSG